MMFLILIELWLCWLGSVRLMLETLLCSGQGRLSNPCIPDYRRHRHTPCAQNVSETQYFQRGDDVCAATRQPVVLSCGGNGKWLQTPKCQAGDWGPAVIISSRPIRAPIITVPVIMSPPTSHATVTMPVIISRYHKHLPITVAIITVSVITSHPPSQQPL